MTTDTQAADQAVDQGAFAMPPAAKVDGVPHVLSAMATVAAIMASTGIGKDRRNEAQKFNFRGIDDVMNALSPVLAQNRLLILPRIISRVETVRTNKSGGVIFSVVVDAEFDFTSAIDGTKVTVRMPGEAMDSADKATNKAMSAAYKYACFQAFCIPVEGTPDADGEHHEVLPPLTPKQLSYVRQLCVDAKVEEGAVAQRFGVQTIEQIPTAAFDKVKNQLNATIARRSQGGQGGQQQGQRQQGGRGAVDPNDQQE